MIMKFRITSIIAFFAAFVLSSCMLVMNDIDFPADQLGFTEPVTQSGPNGTVTYQFNDDVKSVAENVLPYVSHMENDSVLYYFDNTPTEYLPKVGECLSAPISHTLPYGLNHRVTAVDKVPGYFRITTRPAAIGEIYDVYEGSFDFEAESPSLKALDPTEAEALGLLDNDIMLVDYSQLDAADPEAAETYWQNSQHRSRGQVYGVNDSEWKPQNDVGISGEKSITLVELDSRRTKDLSFDFFPDLFKDLTKFVDTCNKELGGGKKLIDSPLYFVTKVSLSVRAKGKYDIGGQRTEGEGSIERITELDGNVTLFPTFHIDFTLGYDNGKPLSKKAKAAIGKFVENRIKRKKASATLPKGVSVPIPGTPLAVYIKPSFTLDLTLSAAGTVSQDLHLDPVPLKFHCEEHLKTRNATVHTSGVYDLYEIDVKKMDHNPYPDYREFIAPQVKNISGKVGVTLGGGFEAGIEAFAVVDVGLYVGLEGSLTAEINFNDTNVEEDGLNEGTADGEFYDSYDYMKNGITSTLDIKAQGRLSAANKLLGSVDIAKFNICKGFLPFMPEVNDMTIKSKEYNDSRYIETVKVAIKYDKTDDLLVLSGLQPAIVITGGEEQIFTMVDWKKEALKNRTYEFTCKVPPELHDMDKILVMPAVRLPSGFIIISEGKVREVNTVNGPVSYGITMEPLRQITGVKVGHMDKSWASWALKNYKGVTPNHYFYQVLCTLGIVPYDDMIEWGIEVRTLNYTSPDGSYTELVPSTYTIPIEKAENRYIARGTRQMLFNFLHSLDAQAYVNDPDWGPSGKMEIYNLELQPYYVRKGETKHRYPSGTNKEGMLDLIYIARDYEPSHPEQPDPIVKEVSSYNLNSGIK